jgi:hypothetical protein
MSRAAAIIMVALLCGCLPDLERWSVVCQHEGKTYEFRDLRWNEFSIGTRSATFYRPKLKLIGDVSCVATEQGGRP